MVEIGYSSLVPTGIWQKYASKFFQKYWWLRSPVTSFGGAWVVSPSGGVDLYDYGVWGSYGRICLTDYSKIL